MFIYRLYDIIIQSDIQLFNIPEAKGNPDAYVKVIYKGDPLYRGEETRLGYSPKYHLLPTQFAVFEIKDGREILIYPIDVVEGELPSYYSSYVIGRCMAFLYSQRGLSTFHCTALDIEGKGVIISGVSGAGKSSVAKCLIERGYKYLVDDLAVIKMDNKPWILPAYPIRKLCHDQIDNLTAERLLPINEGRGKYSYYDDENYRREQIPTNAVFLLDFSDNDTLDINEITGVQKLFIIMECRYLNNIYARFGSEIWDKVTCLKMAESARVFHIRRPKYGDTLEQIVCRIVDIIKKT